MKRKIFSNIELKVLSLVMALTLWILVRGQQRTDLYIQVKVEVENLPNRVMIVDQNSDTINVRLNGPKALIASIDEKYFKPYMCDLSGAVPGEKKCKVLPSAFKTESGLRIMEISPREIKFLLEPIEGKEVPVEPSFLNSLDPGYEIEGYDVYPEALKIAGPASMLSSISILKTTPIDLLGRKRSFVDKFSVGLPNKNVWVEGGTEHVLVNVRIREDQLTRILKDIPVKLLGDDNLVELETKTINVKIYGSASSTEGIRKDEIEAFAELDPEEVAKVSVGERLEARVTLKTLPGVTLVPITPVFVVKKGFSR